jgi:hypothetical protein
MSMLVLIWIVMCAIGAIGAILFAVEYSSGMKRISALTGFSELARKYEFKGTYPGHMKTLPHIRIRWFGASNVFRFATDDVGLYVSTSAIFHPVCKCLFIPWSDFVSVEEKSLMGFRTIKLKLHNPDVVMMFEAADLEPMRSKLPMSGRIIV